MSRRVRGDAESSEFARGAAVAASLADEYNGSTTHRHRLGDCILGKLNLRPGQPRKNARRLRGDKASHAAGMALALAEINRKFDRPSMVVEVAREAGLTLKDLRAAGVDNYDLKELRKAGVK